MLFVDRFRGGGHSQAMQWAHALRDVPLLREIPAPDLLAIWRRLGEQRVEAGTVVCERGQPGDRFYMIQAGALEVRLGVGPGGVTLRRLEAGDCFGEMSLLTDAPRSADVVAVGDAVLWVLERRHFEALLKDRRSLLYALNRALCERVVSMTAQLEERTTGAGATSGMRFGPYRAIEQIGAGGMAAVYSGIHVESEMAVALKVLPPGGGQGGELRDRLAREAAVLRQIAHPNVIAMLDAGNVEVEGALGGGFYLALEWIPHALDRVLRAQYPEPMAIHNALRLAHGVAEGLVAVHAAGIVHRDVKPSNILLRADGTPVLTDMGLSTAVAESAREKRLTSTDVIMGTADYIAPEQVTSAALDPRSDLYSLGVVLHEMVTGVVPFAGRTPLDMLRAKVDEPPPSLPASVPNAVAELITRALQPDPGERFASAMALRDALARAIAAAG